MDTAQANLDQATLKAPFDGVVAAVNIVADSAVSANTTAVTLVDRSTLHIDVSLSETDAAKVQLGQPVTLTFDALPTVTLAGTVATIAPVATTEQNVVTYPVQVTFDPGDTPVKVGMSATADILVDQTTGALLAPSRAIQTSGATKTVIVLQGEAQTPVTVTVETGLTSSGKTAIIGSTPALKAGDVVVVPSTTTTTTSTTQQGGGPGMPFGP
jgi:RND family efflux transporter MFP subunit